MNPQTQVVPYDVVTVGGEAQGQKKTYGGTKSPYSSSYQPNKSETIAILVASCGRGLV